MAGLDGTNRFWAAFGDDPEAVASITDSTLATKIELVGGCIYHFVSDVDLVFKRGDDNTVEIADAAAEGMVLWAKQFLWDVYVAPGMNFFDAVAITAADTGTLRIYRSKGN